jgi:WhiB family transcriptional regulator, redox-sensing transcriptional regulator
MFAYSWSDSDYEIEQPTPLAWQAAACRDGSGSLTELFFSDEIPDIDIAKAICSTCALIVPCLQGALARGEPAGVWGGQLFADGEVIARKRKRGRPPKVAAAMQSEQAPCPDDNVQRPHCVDYVAQRLKTA